MSVYKKESLFAYLSTFVTFLISVFNNFSDMFFLNFITFNTLGIFYLIVTIAFDIILTYTNKKYHYLEQQEGFPEKWIIYDLSN